MNNLGIRQVKNQIINFLNGVPLEVEVKRLILREVYEDFKIAADDLVLKESAEAQKQIKEAKDGTGMATTTDSGVAEQAEYGNTAERG